MKKIFIFLLLFVNWHHSSAITIKNVLDDDIEIGIVKSQSIIKLKPGQKYEIKDLNNIYAIPFSIKSPDDKHDKFLKNKYGHHIVFFKFEDFDLIDHSKIEIINKTNSKKNLNINNLPKNVTITFKSHFYESEQEIETEEELKNSSAQNALTIVTLKANKSDENARKRNSDID